jgi:hypothetical protein
VSWNYDPKIKIRTVSVVLQKEEPEKRKAKESGNICHTPESGGARESRSIFQTSLILREADTLWFARPRLLRDDRSGCQNYLHSLAVLFTYKISTPGFSSLRNTVLVLYSSELLISAFLVLAQLIVVFV